MNPKLLAGFAALLLSACAASSYSRVPLPPQDVQLSNPKLARVYVLRDQQMVGSLRVVRVYQDEREIGAIDENHFLCWERPPGASLLKFMYEGPKIDGGDVEGLQQLECQAGQVYYYRVTIDPSSKRPVSELLDPERGREAVKELEPLPKS